MSASSGSGGPDPRAAVEEAQARIAADRRGAIWIELRPADVVLAEADAVARALDAGADLPLAGITVAVKGNIDVAGIRTTAGCPAYGSVAAAHAPAVQALVDAGAIVLGVTNLDQFATGLVGTRSPHGVCPNAHWPGLISGGSSSGSAVAVAAGHVDLALGTDTAGSGRVPAAANGIFGLKPTRARVSTEGVVPACRSFDCVSLFARDVALARRAFAVLDQTGPPRPARPGDQSARLRVALADPGELTFAGDEGAASGFHDAVAHLVTVLDPAVTTISLAPFLETGRLLYEGAFVRERHEAVGAFVDSHADAVDPVVYSIIHAARDIDPDRLARDRAELERRRAATAPQWDEADVVVIPTVPRLPTVAEVAADPIGVNSMLGTYTNFVNLLGLCAIAVPVVAGRATRAQPPPSLMLLAPAGRDELLLDLAEALTTASPPVRAPAAGSAGTPAAVRQARVGPVAT